MELFDLQPSCHTQKIQQKKKTEFNVLNIISSEICTLLGYYAVSNGNPLPMSVNVYHLMPHNTPQEYASHQHRSGSLKSQVVSSI
jgi:hypothetical protein